MYKFRCWDHVILFTAHRRRRQSLSPKALVTSLFGPSKCMARPKLRHLDSFSLIHFCRCHVLEMASPEDRLLWSHMSSLWYYHELLLGNWHKSLSIWHFHIQPLWRLSGDYLELSAFLNAATLCLTICVNFQQRWSNINAYCTHVCADEKDARDFNFSLFSIQVNSLSVSYWVHYYESLPGQVVWSVWADISIFKRITTSSPPLPVPKDVVWPV